MPMMLCSLVPPCPCFLCHWPPSLPQSPLFLCSLSLKCFPQTFLGSSTVTSLLYLLRFTLYFSTTPETGTYSLHGLSPLYPGQLSHQWLSVVT